ncbi:MAG: hypothetical protein HZA50_13235 [Planctomycetes bacterium]|nr:hypothetical protein [Planctomycetota bacterium]
MAIIAGIDEAGLGPVLGPLVVSSTAFEVPDERLDESLWKMLAGAVVKKASKKADKVAICDSKKLFSSRTDRSISLLERGVLAMLAAAGQKFDSLLGLLKSLAPECPAKIGGYPWYSHGDPPLPQSAGATDVALAGNALASAMSKAGLKFIAMRAEPMFGGEFNRAIAATRNKATVLFDAAARLIVRIWSQSPQGLIRIFVDRQGGRTRYLEPLQRIFDGCKFKIIDESETLSAYRITGPDKTADISFMVRGEDSHLPVALASMLSKYIRELFMGLFNHFWTSKFAGLQPTAGYWTDGNRFFEQIKPILAEMKIHHDMIYRSR